MPQRHRAPCASHSDFRSRPAHGRSQNTPESTHRTHPRQKSEHTTVLTSVNRLKGTLLKQGQTRSTHTRTPRARRPSHTLNIFVRIDHMRKCICAKCDSGRTPACPPSVRHLQYAAVPTHRLWAIVELTPPPRTWLRRRVLRMKRWEDARGVASMNIQAALALAEEPERASISSLTAMRMAQPMMGPIAFMGSSCPEVAHTNAIPHAGG